MYSKSKYIQKKTERFGVNSTVWVHRNVLFCSLVVGSLRWYHEESTILKMLTRQKARDKIQDILSVNI